MTLGHLSGDDAPASASKADTPSRRFVLQVLGLGAAGFAVGCTSMRPLPQTPPAGVSPEYSGQVAFGQFVRIGSDNTVTVVLKHIEFGQGVATGLTTLVAEELEAEWRQMRFEHAPLKVPEYRKYPSMLGDNVQSTGGSSAIAGSWLELRQAGAAAREMLRQAAAVRFGVNVSAVSVSNGRCHVGSRSASFGDLAADAAKQTPPAPEQLQLKEPAQFRFIGKERNPSTVSGRADTAAKINGSAQFALDYHPEGLLIAVLARSPKFGGKVHSVDDTAARGVEGVTDIVTISNGVAVVATNYWSAKKGRDALRITWDNTHAETRSSEAMFADFRQLLDGSSYPVRQVGAGHDGLTGAGDVITVDFEFPYLAHAPMEPLNATIAYQPGVFSVVTTGAQFPSFDQAAACAALGLSPEQVQVNVTLAGGSFGRRATFDADLITEASHIARAINGRAPVKLMWSREDDIRSGKYRPMSVHRMAARISKGKIEAWSSRTAVQSIWEGSGLLPAGKRDSFAIEGSEIHYAIPDIGIDVTWPDSPISVLWWRSSSHSHTAFAKEHFFDILAKNMKVDPLELRRSLLKDQPRMLATLDLAAVKSGWGQPMAPNCYRGIAFHRSFNTCVAEVAEIAVRQDGSFSVDRVVCAVDCGIAVNPDVVRAQMEGSIGMGLSAVLMEQVTIKDGEAVQTNFFDYPVLRLSQMPKVEVYIVASAEAPSGVGEPGLPPLAPAVANAILAATGRPVTRLPIGPKVTQADARPS